MKRYKVNYYFRFLGLLIPISRTKIVSIQELTGLMNIGDSHLFTSESVSAVQRVMDKQIGKSVTLIHGRSLFGRRFKKLWGKRMSIQEV
jgi:hypothetical protein